MKEAKPADKDQIRSQRLKKVEEQMK